MFALFVLFCGVHFKCAEREKRNHHVSHSHVEDYALQRLIFTQRYMFLRILTSDAYHNDRPDVSSSKVASATQLHQTILIVWHLEAFSRHTSNSVFGVPVQYFSLRKSMTA